VSTTLPINPTEQALLDAINRRLDELDQAAAAVLTAADRLPAADRIYVKRRLRLTGQPFDDWASVLRER
jgi:hypothetical protein